MVEHEDEQICRKIVGACLEIFAYFSLFTFLLSLKNAFLQVYMGQTGWELSWAHNKALVIFSNSAQRQQDNIETIGEHFELLLQQFGYFELVLFYVAIRTNNFF